MLANQPPGILAIRTGLRSKARRVSRIANRQKIFIQDFPLMNIGERNLSGRYQKIVPAGQFKQVFFKFRQLSGVRHGLPVDDKRR